MYKEPFEKYLPESSVFRATLERMGCFSRTFRLIVIALLTVFPTLGNSQNHYRSIRKRRSRESEKMDASKLFSTIEHDVIPAAAGCLAFYTTLGLSTTAQKMVGISTGTKVLARMAGVPTVCLAALAGHRCTVFAQEWKKNPEVAQNVKSSIHIPATSAPRDDFYEISQNIRIPKRDVHV